MNVLKDIALGFISEANNAFDNISYFYSKNKYRDVIDSAYYRIFYLCSAIFAIDGKDYKGSKNQTLIGDFNKEYIHTNKLFDFDGGELTALFNMRNNAKYDMSFKIDKSDADKAYSISSNLSIELEMYLNNILSNN